MTDQKYPKLTDKQRSLIMLPILISGFFVCLNETLLNVAYPQLMSNLNVTTGTIQWLSTAYMLTLGIMVPVVPFLLQSFKIKTLFMAAMIIFTLGTIFAGFAPSFSALLVSRIIQGVGAGIIFTMVVGVIVEIYPIARRGAAMGTGIMVVIVAPAVGPTVSGFILNFLNWHWLFFTVLPFAVLAMILGAMTIKNVITLTRPKLDIFSIVLSTLGFGGLLFGISESEISGLLNPKVWVSLLCGIIGLIIFVKRQLKLKQPLLEIRAFQYPVFSLGIAIVFVAFMIPISSSIILTIYLQRVMGLTPLIAALVLLPGNIINFATAPLAGRLFDKLGAKKLVITGFIILIACIFFFSRISLATSLVILIAFHCLFSTSLNLILIPSQTNSLNKLPEAYTPHGVGILNTALQIGGAFGSAIFIGLMGAIEKDRLSNYVYPDIEQIQSAIVSAVDTAFTAALVFVVIGLALAFFLKDVKKFNNVGINQRRT